MLEGSFPEAPLNVSGLEYLDLGGNKIEGFIPENLGNMTSPLYLDLRLNGFEGSIPEALGSLTALRYLNLGSNIHLEGEFPKSIWNLCMLRELYARENNLSKLNLPENIESFSTCTRYSLEVLDLTSNQIMGPFPNLSLFSSLKELSFFSNQFNGTVPESIGQLTQLEDLDISYNSFKGLISEAHFSNLSKLSLLSFSGNSLIFNISSDWIPPFQLDSLNLASCKLGRYPAIGLISNELEGPIPLFLLKVGTLNLSTNGFSKLDSLCDITHDVQTSFLDISFNQLSGEPPDCWTHFRSLKVLVLANNKLFGQIPISIGSLTEIEALHSGNNFFTNEIPDSLKNCTKLKTFDVGENRLSGPIPTWMGETLSNLIVLSLRSNRLSGNIPSHLCHLRHLQLLDLSLSNFSGRIPKCFGHFSVMKKSVESQDTWDTSISHTYSYNSGGAYEYTSYEDELKFIWKGTLSRFSITLGLVKGIDLSSNRLMGEIPTEITELIQLVFLNVSRNNLSGQIPSEIGKLNLLDALDLSNNQLSGGIPSSLTEVARLGVLDLSNNKLSGKIPTGTQLQSFEASSYTGNPELCGAPLLKRCPGDEPAVSTDPPARDEEEDQDKFVTRGFYVTLGLGFLVGFWGVCGSLIFSKTWRYSYFNFLSDANDWIYVTVAVHKAKLLRMIKN
ncbi:hypothetical protein TIFTF001_037324 [Ficus carica]|uniref:Disease resistance R13L4/SHOC-2-like LRR domain-containing protein n=1 Tax=Ficus carica TaxID=3494 RepID=A0AA88EGV2_FICCA|nr:hypothetical protein TIFTF001_037322 [Ficus carica]GMN68269.1 hypothetical protein TIFTF001_037324 [Ficus carica]